MTPADRTTTENSHGRRADKPSDIPKRGWVDILLRVKNDMSRNNISLIAAGGAFYAFLAIPSAFTALISLYGLVSDPGDVQRQVQTMQGVMPEEAVKLISDQLARLSSHSNGTLGIGFIVSLLVALWSAQSGTSSIMRALDIVYGETENRSFFKYYSTAFGLTLATILCAMAALILIAVLPAVIDLLPFGDLGKNLASAVRWPVLIALIMAVLAIVYRYAPSREEAKWRWVSWGAVTATALWIIGSALFSLYVARFAHYDKSYGSLGAVVVLLLWLYVSCYTVLLGGELNAEVEHQTARDSTTGREAPMGQRGARMADTLGDEH